MTSSNLLSGATSTLAALLCVGALGLSACSSAPEPTPDKAEARERIATPYQVEKPSKEELANSPCGNPDWAQLPPGAVSDSAENDATEPAEAPGS